jgi:dienelactone hydrolase
MGPSSEISEGHIDGNTITFKCSRPEGLAKYGTVWRRDRAAKIAFTGRLDGDGIAFTWELEVQDAGGLPRLDTSSVPRRFTAKRVPDGTLAEGFAKFFGGPEFAAAVNLRQKDAKVEGRLFLPQKVSRLRGVVVVIGWGLGFQVYDDPAWRKLAENLEFGLLRATLSHIAARKDNGDLAAFADRGGADGVLILLQRLARESGHQELTNAPLLFWGQSAGGWFGPTFATSHPERTIAFVGYRGGLGENIAVPSHIPALFLAGGKDTGVPWEGMQSIWSSGRAVAAPWTFVVEPNAPHGDPDGTFLPKSDELMIPWVAAVVRQRLGPNGTTLREVTDGSAWMGNNKTGEVAPYGTFPGSKAEASWLPDEPSARGWRAVLGLAK